MKHGVPRVAARDTSTKCLKYDYMGLGENSYSRLKCPECRFEGDRDVTAKLNIRRRALKILELPRGAPTPPTPKADVAPNRWGPPSPRGVLALQRAGRGSAGRDVVLTLY